MCRNEWDISLEFIRMRGDSAESVRIFIGTSFTQAASLESMDRRFLVGGKCI